MKTLVVGARGQLGHELLRTAPAEVEVVSLDHEGLDICALDAVLELVADLQPDVIINAAAYTAVDGAETKPDLAVSVNAEGPGHLARAAERVGARLLHVSTDFVFDGQTQQPYSPRQEPRPLGVYGHSKLAGERRVQEILPLQSVVLRTAWVYSSFGANFVTTMLRLMNERDELRVVADQVGSPTWAFGLAQALWAFLDHPAAHGIFHWSDAGHCSWYDFACAIYSQGRALGLIDRELTIEAIATSEYPTPAQRPAYSVLDCAGTQELLGLEATDWSVQLPKMLQELQVE
jgi:dTDP-4-dehydrorhamnose reductase